MFFVLFLLVVVLIIFVLWVMRVFVIVWFMLWFVLVISVIFFLKFMVFFFYCVSVVDSVVGLFSVDVVRVLIICFVRLVRILSGFIL